MKGVICTAYGPPEVLELREVPEPRPRGKDVCIRVRATAVTASDCIVRGLKLRGAARLALRVYIGFRAPRRILGIVASGEVESAGSEVGAFKDGDAVYGMGAFNFGAYAEKVCWPASVALALKPANLTFEQAAAIPYGGLLASHFLSRLQAGAGERVLVYGASGSIGTSVVQLLRHRGAHVTGVCSGANEDLVRSLGAERVIDYTKEDFTAGGERYDVVFDAVGRRKSAAAMARAAAVLAPNGRMMSVDDGSPRLLASDLVELTRLVEAGEFRPVIDRTYRLEQIVEAHRYVDAGHKKGNVVVTVVA